jgi:hypothetical protein
VELQDSPFVSRFFCYLRLNYGWCAQNQCKHVPNVMTCMLSDLCNRIAPLLARFRRHRCCILPSDVRFALRDTNLRLCMLSQSITCFFVPSPLPIVLVPAVGSILGSWVHYKIPFHTSSCLGFPLWLSPLICQELLQSGRYGLLRSLLARPRWPSECFSSNSFN